MTQTDNLTELVRLLKQDVEQLRRVAAEFDLSHSDDPTTNGIYKGKAEAISHCANKIVNNLKWLDLW